MKKLMITASAILAACVVNAATFVWGIDGGGEIYVPGSTDYLDYGTAMVYLGTVTASEYAFDVGTAKLLATGGYDETRDVFGNVDTGNRSSSADLTSTAAGQAFTVILLAKDGVSTLAGYEGNYVLYTSTSREGVIPQTEGDNIKYGIFTKTVEAIPGDGWSTMAAPEPTSGLLLLIGLAGLSLRRRRA